MGRCAEKSLQKTLIIVTFLLAFSVGMLAATHYGDTYSINYPLEEQQPATSILKENPINFDELQADNPDIIGWIKVDGTVIDYPILRSGPEVAEDFYLNHDMDGNLKSAGSIYIQKLNSADFTDTNTVVYGHNMRNGTMFAGLKKFRNSEFFNQNRSIKVYIPGHILTYTIFSAFVYDSRHLLYSFDFSDDNSYGAFLEECLSPKSRVKNIMPDIKVTTAARIITLSTCTSVGAHNERYLVVGVLSGDERTG